MARKRTSNGKYTSSFTFNYQAYEWKKDPSQLHLVSQFDMNATKEKGCVLYDATLEPDNTGWIGTLDPDENDPQRGIQSACCMSCIVRHGAEEAAKLMCKTFGDECMDGCVGVTVAPEAGAA